MNQRSEEIVALLEVSGCLLVGKREKAVAIVERMNAALASREEAPAPQQSASTKGEEPIGYTSPGALRRLREREDDSLTVNDEAIEGCDVPVYAVPAPSPLAETGETTTLTDEQITKIATVAHAEGRLSWLGFEKDALGFYTVPVLSGGHFQLVRAVLAALTAAQPADGKGAGS